MKKRDYKVKIKRVPKSYKIHPYTEILLDVLSTKSDTDRTSIIEEQLWKLFIEGFKGITRLKLQGDLATWLNINLPGPLDEEFLEKVNALEDVKKALDRKKAA